MNLTLFCKHFSGEIVFNINDAVFINIIMLNITKNYFNNYILSKFAKV
jgi:hypothetical protein